MNRQQTIFLIFVLITIVLAIYGMVFGRWLTRKSFKMQSEVKGDLIRGLKSFAMFPFYVIAIIFLPIYIVSLSKQFIISLNQRNILLLIYVIPSGVYNIYYRINFARKLSRENEKKE
jgi:cell division protein FtsL